MGVMGTRDTPSSLDPLWGEITRKRHKSAGRPQFHGARIVWVVNFIGFNWVPWLSQAMTSKVAIASACARLPLAVTESLPGAGAMLEQCVNDLMQC